MSENLPSIEKLRWQCRRGMLELDYLFSDFLEHQYEQLADTDKWRFVELLRHSDQDLQQWLINRASPADPALIDIVRRVIARS